MEQEFEVAYLKSCRIVNGCRQYLVHWKGYPAADETWENESNLNCEDMLRDFWKNREKHSRNIRKLRIIGTRIEGGQIMYVAQLSRNRNMLVDGSFLSKYYPAEFIQYVLTN